MQIALDLGRDCPGAVGIGYRDVLSAESRGYDRLGSGATSGRGDRGHICPVWSWEHVWDFTGNVGTHRSISLLQWRSFGNADPGQSGHFRKRDEFYVLLDWNHGASGDRVLGHARNRETVSPNG
jgi:hypothetical protein